jgi:hypothetical protein
MARENKRARDERRFGRAERLADSMTIHPITSWGIPGWLQGLDGEHMEALGVMLSWARGFMQNGFGPVIEATNVADYYWSHFNRALSPTDIPVCRPPWEACFVEFSNLASPDPTHRLMYTGFLILDIPPRDTDPTEADRCLMIMPFAKRTDGRPAFLGMRVFRFLDGNGNDIGVSKVDALTEPPEMNGDHGDEYLINATSVALLALAFCNCKNVSISSVDPDPAVNRERHKAGLKPFLRYHTINIDPMKRVLKTEGNVESEGLRRALHECRGHFARYTDNFLGRPLDKPLTVWRPAHVRGSSKEGVVVSDYKVRAPS